MGTLRRLSKARHAGLLGAALVLALALFLRLYHIGWAFSSDGVDEGIMVERSLMVHHGYQIYSDVPSDQAPLAFYIGAVLGGDVVTLRSFVAVLSVLAIAASMLAARKLGGTGAMLIAGLVLAVDFALLRESRLFSLDAISAAFLAFSVLPFLIYLQSQSRAALGVSGLMVGLSTTSKLLGVLGLIGMLVFLALEIRSKSGDRRRLALDAVLLVIVTAIPVAIAMVLLGPADMIQGMVLDQGHRGYDLGLKLSILAFFAVNLAYLIPLIQARSSWKLRPELRYLLCVSFVVLAFMIVQPLTFLHHMVMLSFPLAILTGASLSGVLAQTSASQDDTSTSVRASSRRRANPLVALALVGILVSSGLGVYGLVEQHGAWQDDYARLVEEASSSGEWVVSGDPLITAEAGRLTPPQLINVAYRQYPELTEAEFEAQILRYNVSIVVICYRLAEMPGLAQFLEENGYKVGPPAVWLSATSIVHLPPTNQPVLNLFEDKIGPVEFFYKQ